MRITVVLVHGLQFLQGAFVGDIGPDHKQGDVGQTLHNVHVRHNARGHGIQQYVVVLAADVFHESIHAGITQQLGRIRRHRTGENHVKAAVLGAFLRHQLLQVDFSGKVIGQSAAAGARQLFAKGVFADIGVHQQHLLAGGGQYKRKVGGQEGFAAVREERGEQKHLAPIPVGFEVFQIGTDNAEGFRDGVPAVLLGDEDAARLLLCRLFGDLTQHRQGAVRLHFAFAVDGGVHHAQEEVYQHGNRQT